MDNVEFKKVENIRGYLTDGLNCGEFKIKTYQKSGEITARVGEVGEEIFTVMANGFKETKNTVTVDENGNPSWIVTNSTGEQYVVSDSVFKSKYEKIEGTEDGFKPVWNPITAVQLNENISFVAPWGEMQYLAAGGYLVFNKAYDDIYGVQKDEFNKTYDLVEFGWAEADKVICKEKEDYKYAIKNIKKEDLYEFLTSESEIAKAEYRGDSLCLYLSGMDNFTDPIIKKGECYWNCLLVVNDATIASSNTKQTTSPVPKNRLAELEDILKHRSLYMSFREFLSDGASDATILFDGNNLVIDGYGRDFKNSSLWVKICIDFDCLDFYCDEIYDYMTGEGLDK